MSDRKTQQFEGLYGPCYKYSDLKVGNSIAYRGEDNERHTGVIVWVIAPSQGDPMRYLVEEQDDSFPDIVYPSEVTPL